jgi:hypothetical protein
MAKPTLIYFATRGRAEVTRLVLAEAAVDYTEESFKGPEALAALKASGRLPFLRLRHDQHQPLRALRALT